MQSSLSKPVLITIISSLLATYSLSQYSFSSYNSKHFQNFLESTTLVLKTENNTLDSIIETTLDRFWTFTELKYVSKDEFYNFGIKKDSNIFSGLFDQSMKNFEYISNKYSKIELFTYEVDESYSSRILAVHMPKNLTNTRLSNIVAAVPVDRGVVKGLASKGTELSFKDIEYKLRILLLQLTEIIDFVLEEKFIPRLSSRMARKYYVEAYNRKIIDSHQNYSKKKLLVNNKIFSKYLDSTLFAEIYKHDYEIVSEKNHHAKISENNLHYYYLIQTHDPLTVLSVFDPSKNQTLFIELTKNGGLKGFEVSKKQIKSLNNHMTTLLSQG